MHLHPYGQSRCIAMQTQAFQTSRYHLIALRKSKRLHLIIRCNVHLIIRCNVAFDLRSQIWDLRSEISNLRSQIWNLRSEISDLRCQRKLLCILITYVRTYVRTYIRTYAIKGPFCIRMYIQKKSDVRTYVRTYVCTYGWSVNREQAWTENKRGRRISIDGE